MHSEPQKIDFQHQLFTKKLKFDTKKGVFQHQLVDAQKMARHQVCTSRAPPPPQAPKLAKRFKPARGLAKYIYIYYYTIIYCVFPFSRWWLHPPYIFAHMFSCLQIRSPNGPGVILTTPLLGGSWNTEIVELPRTSNLLYLTFKVTSLKLFKEG